MGSETWFEYGVGPGGARFVLVRSPHGGPPPWERSPARSWARPLPAELRQAARARQAIGRARASPARPWDAPQDQAAHEGGLADVLEVVLDDAHQPHPQGHRRVPAPVDYPVEVGVRPSPSSSRAVSSNTACVVAPQQVGAGLDHGHLVGVVAVTVSRTCRRCKPNRSSQPPAVQTCSMPATSQTWSSWTLVKCQTSQAIELASGSARKVSSASLEPVQTRRRLRPLRG